VINCFTEAIKYLDERHDLPQRWGKYELDVRDMDYYVLHQRGFLARRDHYGFFGSFCDTVKNAQKGDVILTDECVGIAINRYAYWVMNEHNEHIEHSIMTKGCTVMRVRNG
jgi:hypothetical protein